MTAAWKRTVRYDDVPAVLLMPPHGLTTQPAASQPPAGPPSAAEPSATGLAKPTQNRIVSLACVPLQGNWDPGIGDQEATGVLLDFRSAIPIHTGLSTNFVFQGCVQLASQPVTNESLRERLGPRGHIGGDRGSGLTDRTENRDER